MLPKTNVKQAKSCFVFISLLFYTVSFNVISAHNDGFQPQGFLRPKTRKLHQHSKKHVTTTEPLLGGPLLKSKSLNITKPRPPQDNFEYFQVFQGHRKKPKLVKRKRRRRSRLWYLLQRLRTF